MTVSEAFVRLVVAIWNLSVDLAPALIPVVAIGTLTAFALRRSGRHGC